MFPELYNVFPADGRRKEIWIYGSISRERMNECKWGVVVDGQVRRMRTLKKVVLSIPSPRGLSGQSLHLPGSLLSKKENHQLAS